MFGLLPTIQKVRILQGGRPISLTDKELSMSELRVVVMDKCQECNGTGVSDTRYGIPVKCSDCDGEGVSERQIKFRDLRHLAEADAKAEREEMGAGRLEGDEFP
jgi:DnaJ-class molecular chaperone